MEYCARSRVSDDVGSGIELLASFDGGGGDLGFGFGDVGRMTVPHFEKAGQRRANLLKIADCIFAFGDGFGIHVILDFGWC